MTDQRALVDKILAGDKGSFRILIEKYQRLVFHIVFRMVPGDADREDLCQEIFLKVYQHLPNFRFDSKLSTWIARVAHNNCLNFLEKKKLPLYDDLIDENDTREPEATGAVMPDERLANIEISGILQKEIERLPATYKTIVTLFHLEEMTYAEIADIMKMPEGTVKSYLFRGRRVLKERLSLSYRREDL
jgi:RNA polymerase sigma-70 factor (ECF subfamily)